MSGAGAPTVTTLVTGPNAAARETAILAALLPGQRCAIVLEGLPDGSSTLAPEALAALSPTPVLHRIAPGCLCCSGNLVLRVTLNRILRQRPARLYLALANAEHLQQLRALLAGAPYDALLALTPDLRAPPARS